MPRGYPDYSRKVLADVVAQTVKKLDVDVVAQTVDVLVTKVLEGIINVQRGTIVNRPDAPIGWAIWRFVMGRAAGFVLNPEPFVSLETVVTKYWAMGVTGVGLIREYDLPLTQDQYLEGKFLIRVKWSYWSEVSGAVFTLRLRVKLQYVRNGVAYDVASVETAEVTTTSTTEAIRDESLDVSVPSTELKTDDRIRVRIEAVVTRNDGGGYVRLYVDPSVPDLYCFMPFSIKEVA